MPPSRTDPPAPRLGDFLCFSVYSANLAFGRAYKPLLDGLGLTYPQFIALVALWEEDDQTVGGLGSRLFLESNTLTPVIKKLEALGYLTRRRDPADERQVRVRLTDAGRRLRDRAGAVTLAGRIGLSAEEAAKLQQAVSALRDSLLRAPEG